MRLKLLIDFHQTIIPGTQIVRGLRLPKYQVRNVKKLKITCKLLL